MIFKRRKVEDLQFTAEEAAIDRSDLEVISRAVQVQLFSTQVLCRVSHRVLEYSTDAGSSCC